MRYSHADIEPCFDPGTWRKGWDYFRAGRVIAAQWNGGGTELAATVRGTRAEPYSCSVIVEGRPGRADFSVNGECSCPVGYNCKHVVAALLEGASGSPVDAVAAQAALAAQRTRVLAAEWNQWLAQVKATAAARAPAPAPTTERLLYLLDFEPAAGRARRVAVAVAQVRLKKDGQFGRPQRYFVSPQARPAFAADEDEAVLLELRARQPYYAAQHTLESDWGAALLPRLLATGRAYWKAPGVRPLRAGTARDGSFAWVAQDDGTRRLRLEVGGASEILPLAPPWYLDLERGEAGPVRTAIAPAVAERLLGAPALPAELDRAVTIGLAEALGEQVKELPAPAAVEVRTLSGIAPRPQLRLTRRRVQLGYARPAESDCAVLSFAYGDIGVGDAEEGPVLRRAEKGAVTILHRDLAAEGRARSQLLQFRFVPAAGETPGESLYVGHGPDFWPRTLLETVPALRAQGWDIREDPGFGWRIHEAEDAFDIAVEESANDWLGLALDVTVDGTRVAMPPLLVRLLQSEPGLRSPQDVQPIADERPFLFPTPDGRWFRLPGARIKPWLSTLLELFDPAAIGLDGRLRLPRLAAPLIQDLAAQAGARLSAAQALQAFAQRLREFKGIAPVAPPAGLQAELRPYQREGLAWLQWLRELGVGGVLADDMGLGKTVQALAHLLIEKEGGRLDRPSLVVAPTSLIFNWKREAQRFAPGLKVLALQGLQRRDDFARIAGHDLVLTTYPLLPRDFDALSAQDYHLLILDEAQNIKNAKSKAAQLVRGLPARHRLALTGTPMENHLGELWALMDFLTPGFLGDEAGFKRRYRTPIERHGDALVRAQLSRRLAPFLLRRTKAEVAKELPPRTDIVRSVALDGAQRELYETVRVAMDKKVRDEIAKKGLARSHIMILDALLKLRQICCDPRLLKLNAGRRVRESAKLDLLMDLLPEMLEEGRRVLLFSQFTSMLALIETALSERGIAYVKLTGDTTDRETPVTRFQNGEVPLFLISLKAGGVGLNLTAADTVIHYDPWWNPAVEQQATDRAHRIGQDKPVFVYKLLTEGTVEEKIAQLQARKRDLAEALFKEGGAAAGWRLEELAELFTPLA